MLAYIKRYFTSYLVTVLSSNANVSWHVLPRVHEVALRASHHNLCKSRKYFTLTTFIHTIKPLYAISVEDEAFSAC